MFVYSHQDSQQRPPSGFPPKKLPCFGAWVDSHAGEGNGNPLQYSCLENPMDRGAWKAAVHGVAKSWTRLSGFIFTFYFHALEKEMAAHSSIIAWRIPGTAEPGGLPVYGVTQSRTRLKRLSSSSSRLTCSLVPPCLCLCCCFSLQCLPSWVYLVKSVRCSLCLFLTPWLLCP